MNGKNNSRKHNYRQWDSLKIEQFLGEDAQIAEGSPALKSQKSRSLNGNRGKSSHPSIYASAIQWMYKRNPHALHIHIEVLGYLAIPLFISFGEFDYTLFLDDLKIFSVGVLVEGI